MADKEILVLGGATAVGKTAFALELAKQLNIEIISADSMQVYKTLDIGTAKPTKSERSQVPHHMIDVISPLEEFNAAKFAERARVVIANIKARGKLPVIVGGTGFYLESLINNYSFTSLSGRRKEQNMQDHALVVCLNKPREELYAAIDSRVDEMLQGGLIEEVKVLYSIGARENTQSMQAIGYKEFLPYLNGEIAFEQAVLEVKQNSRNYAKRQLTWFRGMQGVLWFELPKQRAIALAYITNAFEHYKK